MKIVESFLTKNPCYVENKKINPKGLMLHSVGCPQPKASAFINYWNSPNFKDACVHAFIDAIDGTVYQTLPWTVKAWHGGGMSNVTHIGVEMCEPDCIKYTGGASFVCTNMAKAKEYVSRTYNSAVELFAFLCVKYNLNPLADGVIISHSEGYKRGIASNHGDPEHLWKGLGTGYTMDGFRKDVKKKVDAYKQPSKPTNTTEKKTIYRVQAGAYEVKANAEKQLTRVKAAGFDAFVVKVGKYYKIQMGAYEVKANAERQLTRVKAAGFDAFITTATL